MNFEKIGRNIFYSCFLMMLLSSCIKKKDDGNVNATNDVLTAKQQILRAKELYLENDYKNYLNEIIFPAANRAKAVLKNFKQRHSKIEKSTWNTTKVGTLLSELWSVESKLKDRTSLFEAEFSAFVELLKEAFKEGQKWSSEESKSKKNLILARGKSLTSEVNLMLNRLSKSGNRGESRVLYGILRGVHELTSWTHMLNVDAAEMDARLTAAEEVLGVLNKQNEPSSVEIYFAFKKTLCEFVFSSARIWTHGEDKNSKLKLVSNSPDLCDQETHDIVKILEPKRAWIMPFWGPLSKADFNEVASVPLMILGIDGAHVTNSDGALGTQYDYYSHDLDHAGLILTHVFGDFEPASSGIEMTNQVKLLAQTKMLNFSERLLAREAVYQQFMAAAMTKDMDVMDRKLISGLIFEIVHEIPPLECGTSKEYLGTFPRCSYEKTLAKSLSTQMLPGTYLKRYLMDGLQLFAELSNDYWLEKVMKESTAGIVLETKETAAEQTLHARKVLVELNKRVERILEW